MDYIIRVVKKKKKKKEKSPLKGTRERVPYSRNSRESHERWKKKKKEKEKEIYNCTCAVERHRGKPFFWCYFYIWKNVATI